MPSQSRLLPFPFDIAGSALVTRNYPLIASDVLRNYLSQTSPLVIPLDPIDIHYAGSTNRLALDRELAEAFWYTIKRIARVIYRAANPNLDPWNLAAGIPEARLREIGLPHPDIVNALQATQNPCFLLGSRQEIMDTFAAMQKWGVEGLQWSIEARVRCAVLGNEWKWDSAPNELFPPVRAILSEEFSEYADRALTWLDNSALITDPSRMIEWHGGLSENHESKALILHPTASNAAQSLRNKFNPYGGSSSFTINHCPSSPSSLSTSSSDRSSLDFDISTMAYPATPSNSYEDLYEGLSETMEENESIQDDIIEDV